MSIPSGRYELIKSDKYDEWMKAVGIGAIQRGIVNKLTPVVEWINLGNGKYNQKTTTTFKNLEIEFVLGEEFDEITPGDGKPSRTTFKLEGNKLTQTQVKKEHTVVIVHTFNGDEVVATLTVGDVVSTRTYKKIA